MTFGLNALYGREKLSGNAWGGEWDHTNTQDFMNYTVSKGYTIDSWEFGMYITCISFPLPAPFFNNFFLFLFLGS